MDRERTKDPHWDREQWAPEGGEKPKEPEGKTWERHEWASDQPGTPREDAEDEREGMEPGETGPTGEGMPPGESHWGRTEHKE